MKLFVSSYPLNVPKYNLIFIPESHYLVLQMWSLYLEEVIRSRKEVLRKTAHNRETGAMTMAI